MSFKDYRKDSKMPLGIQRNNPGNLVFLEGNAWLGQTKRQDQTRVSSAGSSVQSRFTEFDNIGFGIRASMINLRNYYFVKKLRTINDIIGTWAPKGDNNDVNAYAAFVADGSGIDPDKVFEFTRENCIKILFSMFQMECGSKYGAYFSRTLIADVYDGKAGETEGKEPIIMTAGFNNWQFIALLIIVIGLFWKPITKFFRL